MKIKYNKTQRTISVLIWNNTFIINNISVYLKKQLQVLYLTDILKMPCLQIGT